MPPMALGRFGGPDFVGTMRHPLTHSSTALVRKMSRQALFGHGSGYQWGSAGSGGSVGVEHLAQVPELNLLGTSLARALGRARQHGGDVGRVREAAALGSGGDQLQDQLA